MLYVCIVFYVTLTNTIHVSLEHEERLSISLHLLSKSSTHHDHTIYPFSPCSLALVARVPLRTLTLHAALDWSGRTATTRQSLTSEEFLLKR